MNRILIPSKTNNFQKILHKNYDSVLRLDLLQGDHSGRRKRHLKRPKTTIKHCSTALNFIVFRGNT